MRECELIGECSLLRVRLAAKPATAALMRKRHCEVGKAQCARKLVHRALGPQGVPANLYPTETERALTLIEGSSTRA